MTQIVNGVLRRGDQVLLAHRSPQRSTYAGTWSFPGGHVERGESREQALVRELGEEIGVVPTCWAPVWQFDDPGSAPGRPVTFHVFVVDAWQGTAVNTGDEHTEIRWVRLRDARRMTGLTFASYIDLFDRLLAS